jgi:hypothetical protein
MQFFLINCWIVFFFSSCFNPSCSFNFIKNERWRFRRSNWSRNVNLNHYNALVPIEVDHRVPIIRDIGAVADAHKALSLAACRIDKYASFTSFMMCVECGNKMQCEAMATYIEVSEICSIFYPLNNLRLLTWL